MIITVSINLEDAVSLSDMFYYMGIPSCALTPEEAVMNIPSYCRAVIVMAGSEKNIYHISEKTTPLNIPIFTLGNSDLSRLGEKIDDSLSCADIVSRICTYNKAHGIKSPTEYALGEIDTSLILTSPTFTGIKLPFTKTEALIMRTLISAYPDAIESGDILKYAFRKNRTPDISSIRTHISIMNKKIRSAVGKNVIEMISGKGYIIKFDKSATPNLS